jgi:DNA-binding NtrC family response regulator
MAPAVLVVDDDASVAATVREALRGHDVTIEAAATAESACELLDEGRFCGVVLDVVLEGGSAFDVLRHMRVNAIDLPVVVVTQHLPSYVQEMLREDQVKLVLPKPVEARLLGAVVLGLCGIQS